MKTCEDCGYEKTVLRTCRMCKRAVCNYCFKRRHSLMPRKGRKKPICLPSATAMLWGDA